MNEYNKNSNWSKSFIKELAKKLGLTSTQVYKWNWDQRKKDTSINNSSELIITKSNSEFD